MNTLCGQNYLLPTGGGAEIKESRYRPGQAL